MKNVLLILLIFTVSLLSAQDKTAKDYKIEGAEAYKAKDYQKGLTSFEKSIQMYEADGKVDTSLYYNAAICALKVDNYDKSLQYFNRSISLGYKPCKSQLYKANAYKKKEDYATMETECNSGITSCPKYKKKFNDLLFGYYLKSGLDIFNAAAKMQADVTPLASTDPDKYVTEMEKVKAEFNKSIPMLEKANAIDPDDQNCTKALNQARKIVATEI
jgi:tetratricopeptide (TPR) repeat protein